MTEKSELGAQAEDLACMFLRNKGYRILDRNWRRPWGELDIVAEQSKTVHFVEVKASRRLKPGFDPVIRADGWKMHKVLRTAKTWLAFRRLGPETEWQLDVISVIMEPEVQIEMFEQI
jgi:putative endonuclease